MGLLLKKFPDEISSTRHYGIRNISSQPERRSRFAEILRPYIVGLDFLKEMREFHTNHFTLLDYVQENEIKRAIEAVNYVRTIEQFSFTDESIAQLFLQLVYVQSCHRLWSKVDVGTLAEDMLEGMKESEMYRSAAVEICKIVKIDDPKEYSYFQYLFTMLRKQKIEDRTIFVDAMRDTINEIFERIHQRLTIDFAGDQELFNGLAVHIYSTVVRRDKLGKELQESTVADIRNQYPFGFEMAAVAAEVIMENFAYKVSSAEMMYLTLHFQAGIERMKNIGKKVRVLVVCHYGLAAASLISVRIEQMFPAIKIIESVSMQHFLKMKNIQADLVLSTENIKVENNLPVIYVTPTLADSEVKQIKRFVETNCIESLLTMFLQNSMIVTAKADEKEKILRESAKKLQAEGFVTKGFIESILAREKISTTDIDIIAVPHGNPDFVKETQLLIVRVSNGVEWGHGKVKIIFIFAISKEHFEKNFVLFSSFYKRLAKTDVRSELKKICELDDVQFKKSLIHILSQ